jgi:hypothetical protein
MKKISISNIIGKIVRIPKETHNQFLTDFENRFRIEIFGEDGLKNNPKIEFTILDYNNKNVSYYLKANNKNLLNTVIKYLNGYQF